MEKDRRKAVFFLFTGDVGESTAREYRSVSNIVALLLIETTICAILPPWQSK